MISLRPAAKSWFSDPSASPEEPWACSRRCCLRAFLLPNPGIPGPAALRLFLVPEACYFSVWPIFSTETIHGSMSWSIAPPTIRMTVTPVPGSRTHLHRLRNVQARSAKFLAKLLTCGDGFRAIPLRRPGLCRPGAPRPPGPRSSPQVPLSCPGGGDARVDEPHQVVLVRQG